MELKHKPFGNLHAKRSQRQTRELRDLSQNLIAEKKTTMPASQEGKQPQLLKMSTAKGPGAADETAKIAAKAKPDDKSTPAVKHKLRKQVGMIFSYANRFATDEFHNFRLPRRTQLRSSLPRKAR